MKNISYYRIKKWVFKHKWEKNKKSEKSSWQQEGAGGNINERLRKASSIFENQTEKRQFKKEEGRKSG